MAQYAIYLRKSRADIDAEARGEGETLARHEKTLLELAKLQKLNIVEIYKEVVSGETIAARPVVQRLLHEVERGVWTGVLVMEVERLARGDTIDQGIMAQTFKYSNTKIITPVKTYDPNNEFDEEYFEFGLFMSRREYKTINRRLQQGRLTSVKEGKYVANQAAYGYVRKKLEKEKGYTLEPHPEESEIVKLIFELYTRGEKQNDGTYKRKGVSLICRRLNNLRVPPKKSDAWVPASVRDILMNPVYNGKIRWNWRPAQKRMSDGEIHVERPRVALENCVIVEGLHQPIIDGETWQLAQVYLKQNPPHPGPSQYPLKNPLSGIVFCGKCGRSMSRRPYNKSEREPVLMCPVTSCDNISSPLSLVESHILDALRNWLREYKLSWDAENRKLPLVNEIDIKTKALQKLDDEIKNLDKQMGSLHDLLEQGIYSTEKFLERTKILSERIKESRQERNRLSNDIGEDASRNETRKNIVPKIERLLEVYPKADPKLKNDLLKEVLQKVVYTKTSNARWHSTPDDFQIDLYPKISN